MTIHPTAAAAAAAIAVLLFFYKCYRSSSSYYYSCYYCCYYNYYYYRHHHPCVQAELLEQASYHQRTLQDRFAQDEKVHDLQEQLTRAEMQSLLEAGGVGEESATATTATVAMTSSDNDNDATGDPCTTTTALKASSIAFSIVALAAHTA